MTTFDIFKLKYTKYVERTFSEKKKEMSIIDVHLSTKNGVGRQNVSRYREKSQIPIIIKTLRFLFKDQNLYLYGTPNY